MPHNPPSPLNADVFAGRPKKKQRMTERDRIFWERVKKEEESGSGYEVSCWPLHLTPPL